MKYLIIAALVIAAIVRIVLPWDYTFLNGEVRLNQVDSYFSMYLVDKLINGEPVVNYNALTEYIIYGVTWLITRGQPDSNTADYVGALLNAIYGVITVLLVSFLTKNLFNKKVALVSIFLASIMPGEFLVRSALGFTDHHALELVFLSAEVSTLTKE